MPPLVCDHIPVGTVTVNGKHVLCCVPCARAYLRSLPCSVRCWRVGGPVDVAPGETCPECGAVEPTPAAADALTAPAAPPPADHR